MNVTGGGVEIYSKLPKPSPFVGEWMGIDLPTEGDPCKPDEEIIQITDRFVNFPNGGGDFANDQYSITNGKIIFAEGDEKIEMVLIDD